MLFVSVVITLLFVNPTGFFIRPFTPADNLFLIILLCLFFLLAPIVLPVVCDFNRNASVGFVRRLHKACIDKHPFPYRNVMARKLFVKLRQQFVHETQLCQCRTKSTDGAVVGRYLFHLQSQESGKGD
ncbi:hypothetical protein Pgin03_01682 [Porphyromonas gingivalis]